MEGIVTDLERVTDFSALIKMNDKYFSKHKKAPDSSDSDAEDSTTKVTGHDSDDDRISPSANAAAQTAAKAAKVEAETKVKAKIIKAHVAATTGQASDESDNDSDDDIAAPVALTKNDKKKADAKAIKKIEIDAAVSKQVAKTKAAITTVSKAEKKAKDAVK